MHRAVELRQNVEQMRSLPRPRQPVSRRGNAVTARHRVLLLLGSALVSACVTPRVQLPVVRPQEARLETDRVFLADGAVLPLAQWLPATVPPRAAIVALHGLNDYRAAWEGSA